MADAVVIGAGVGGLSAAITLAAKGLAVEVVEAAAEPGGKVGVAVLDGVEVDTGPSVLTLPEVFAELLALADMRIDEVLTLRRPEPSFRYLYADGVQLDIFHALDQTLASVERTLGREAADELSAFATYAADIWEAAAPNFVYGAAPSIGRILWGGIAQIKALARIDPLHTMWAAITNRVRSPHLRLLLARYATYNGSDVRRAPATLNCIAHVELALGGYGVEGGMYQVVRALTRAAERLGVVLRYERRVEAVVVTHERVGGVVLDDGVRIDAARVIANADATHVAQSLLPSSLRRAIPTAGERSMSGYNAIIAARRRHGDAARTAHTVLFPADYEQEFADIFDRDRPPREPTVYLCAQERCHGRDGWPDREPLFVMANAPAEPRTGSSGDDRWAELQQTVLRRLRDAGLVDDDDAPLWNRTPQQLAARFPGSRGSIYGIASNGARAAFRRPANTVSQVPGLFLASGSAHPGGGMPLAALSGRAAAAAALADARS